MNEAWTEIERLISVNATHRKGFRIADVSNRFVLLQAKDELDELFQAPDDVEELADVLGILFHYAIKRGWQMDEIEDVMLRKFKARFELERAAK